MLFHRYHSFLFAIYPILLLASINLSEISLNSIWLPLAIALGVTLLLRWILERFLKDDDKAAVIVTLLVGLFYSYGPLVSIKGDIKNLLHIGLSNDEVLLYSLLLAGALLVWMLRTRKNLAPLNNVLNVMTITLVVFPLGTLLMHLPEFFAKPAPKTAVSSDLGYKTQEPDVYYILLDGYGRGDVLQKNYHVDNAPFLDALRERGFIVASKSCANYPRTFLSLASSLHMKYLDDVAAANDPKSSDFKPYVELIRDNPVIKTFKQRGYRYIHVGSWFYATKKNDLADVNITGPGDEFTEMLLHSSILEKLLGGELTYHSNRKHVLASLAQLEHVAEQPSPKFVYAHVITPHPPLYFTADGDEPDDAEETEDLPVYEKNLAGNLAYVNKRLLGIIDGIRKQSKTPPVIILQSDHGPKEFSGGSYYPFTPELIGERIPILTAMLLPPGYEKPPQTLSMVNTYRFLFSQVFGMDYPMLPNRHYFIKAKQPFKHYDVTEQAPCR